ncbi:MBL fold metallo-hydrolase [Sinirhodobacter populi]|nr:MBL fold metallo-hydrolase [Sinirhodobacter populi]
MRRAGTAPPAGRFHPAWREPRKGARMAGPVDSVPGGGASVSQPAPTGQSASRGAGSPDVFVFHDARTGSLQYVVADPASGAAAIIDPVLDFDERSGSIATASADRLLDFIAARGLRVEWILDTHPHADHFSAAHYLKMRTGAPMAIGAGVRAVQALWRDIYNWPGLAVDGSQWDRLFAPGDSLRIGGIEGRVIAAPGHTLASVTYVIGDAAFVHDTIFMPDSGTARADFPGGSAGALWDSIQDILSLPDDTRLFTGHDYCPEGRAPQWESTPATQRATNTHLTQCPTREAFVAMRTARDRTLPMPNRILQALQVNINGGRLPEPEANGRRYLKIPLDLFPDAAWD